MFCEGYGKTDVTMPVDLFVNNIKMHYIISHDDFPRVIAFEKEQP